MNRQQPTDLYQESARRDLLLGLTSLRIYQMELVRMSPVAPVWFLKSAGQLSWEQTDAQLEQPKSS
jgi:hypothetical protein